MSVIVPDNVISKVQCVTRTLGFSEPVKNHHGVPTRYCVLVGLKDIKFSPFTPSEKRQVILPFFISCNFIERGPRGILCTRGAYCLRFTVRLTNIVGLI